MRICGDAHLLSCSHLVGHTSIPHIFWVNIIGLFMEDGIFSCITSFICYDLEFQRVICAMFALIIAHLPCFKIL